MSTESGATRQGGRCAIATNRHDAQPTLKGTLDRTAALLLVVLLAPLLLIIAVAAWSDGGPVLVRQERVGAGGRRFQMLSFAKDVRVGPLLQHYSLVGLPQLFNVLGGSMSLVGPRPALVGEAGPDGEACAPVVKPGLAWFAEPDDVLDGCCDPEPVELRYARRWTPALDARILARALRCALTGHPPRASR